MQDEGGKTYTPTLLPGESPVSPEQARAFRRQNDTMYHSSPAGYYDPVTITLLLDMLLRCEHDTCIRARDLRFLLDVEYPQMMWTDVTIGRVLSDLAEAARGSGVDPTPIEQQRTTHGHKYVLNITRNGWVWLRDARIRMGDYAEQLLASERRDRARITLPAFPFDVLDEVSQVPQRKEGLE